MRVCHVMYSYTAWEKEEDEWDLGGDYVITMGWRTVIGMF